MEAERPEPKRPYVPPRVLQVQRRASGDNLATGCKISGEFALGGEVNGNTCSDNSGTCFDTGS